MIIQKNNFTDTPIDQDTYMLDIYTQGTGVKTIFVAEQVSLTYLLLAKEQVNLDLRIVSAGIGAKSIVKTLCLAKKDADLTIKLHAHLLHDYATADIHMISFLQNDAVCEIDGGVDLHAGTKKVAGHLLEENIILGDKIKIKTLPMLDVRSSDVSASHGARIERLDEKKLFYLKSRGLDTTQAKELIIGGYFEQVFAPFKHEQDTLDISRLEKEWIEYLLS